MEGGAEGLGPYDWVKREGGELKGMNREPSCKMD